MSYPHQFIINKPVYRMHLKYFPFILGMALLLPGLATAADPEERLVKLRYEENYSPTWEETIGMFRLLDEAYKEAVLVEAGMTDCGKPLHTFIISSDRTFDPAKVKASGKTVLLVNNGIHPGEPEGIDASLLFAGDLLRNHQNMGRWLEEVVVVIIPVYNIGGALNRSAYNRSGQATPYETGFRGNAANLDLNRDFTKCDSENARSFTQIFHQWDPDVFLDTHTTNGSDHQYCITLIPPHPDQYPPALSRFLDREMLPALYTGMKQGEYELIPYVDWFYEDARSGIVGTFESPRYSIGYSGLFHSLGMITENLIYKPFPDRVKSVYQFLTLLTGYTAENGKKIRELREEALRETMEAREFPLSWRLDSTSWQMIEFKGYEMDEQQVSAVTGVARKGYDRSRPYTDSIRYYNKYVPAESVPVPDYYVVPQAWKPVLERMALNRIQHTKLLRDTVIRVTVDYIEDLKGAVRPYNGHYYHDSFTTRSEVQEIRFYAGDWLVPVRQKGMRYIIEMLEPKAKDSFFRWNFYDSVLDQREYFSPYGFEENALRTLTELPELKKELEKQRSADPAFAASHNAQMAFIYNNSPWFEKSWRRYPVGRIFSSQP